MAKQKSPEQKLELGNSLDPKLNIKEFKWTSKQKQFFELIQKEYVKLIIVEGPAGSSKTLVAIYSALKALKEEKIEQILYIRSAIESASRSLGSLPGSELEKFEPFTIPLRDKLDELLKQSVTDKLLEKEFIKPLAINFLRGTNIVDSFVVIDETQNMTLQEIKTAITRIGRNTKMVLCADSNQSDINGKSGFSKIYNLFNDQQSMDNGVWTFKFDEEDIMRSGITQYIVSKLSKLSKIS